MSASKSRNHCTLRFTTAIAIVLRPSVDHVGQLNMDSSSRRNVNAAEALEVAVSARGHKNTRHSIYLRCLRESLELDGSEHRRLALDAGVAETPAGLAVLGGAAARAEAAPLHGAADHVALPRRSTPLLSSGADSDNQFASGVTCAGPQSVRQSARAGTYIQPTPVRRAGGGRQSKTCLPRAGKCSTLNCAQIG